jgi:recombination protein RecT
VVFDDEVFELEYGFNSTRKFRHVPNLRQPRDPAKAYCVYLIARLKDGSEHFEIMTMDEVRAIRDGSQAWKFKPNSGPWHDNFLQMARKTVIRRAANYLPLSAEMVAAMEMEDDGDTAAAKSIIDGAVRKPDLTAAPAQDIASQMAAREPEPQDAETVDPKTGEVTSAAAAPANTPEREPGDDEDDSGPGPTPEQLEPEKGTVDHLIWRIWRASAEELGGLVKEAAGLSKDEPRRMNVSAAIARRRKEVAS